MLLCQNLIFCEILSLLYDSNGFKPYICFDFHNMSMNHTHTHTHTHTHVYIYSIGPTLKSVEYRVFEWFPKFLELPRLFSPEMFGLWPGHVRVSGFQGI
jgi:hypothetical protein